MSPPLRPNADARADARQGLAHAALAYLLWGLLPFYFHLLTAVPPIEVLAHRILWSLVLLLALLGWRRELGDVARAMREPRHLAALAASALFIAVNWFAYIWAVAHAHVIAASLGYFLNPLVSVLLGIVFLGERLRAIQWVALALAAAGVAILAAGAPQTLWVSLILAVSFALYGLIRKLTPVTALAGLAVETIVLAGPALAILAWEARHEGVTFGHAPVTTALLLASGVITSTPLLLFASGARRLPLVTLGLLQYIAPTMQFLIALIAFDEPMTLDRWASFAFIWLGLAIFALVTVTPRKADSA